MWTATLHLVLMVESIRRYFRRADTIVFGNAGCLGCRGLGRAGEEKVIIDLVRVEDTESANQGMSR